MTSDHHKTTRVLGFAFLLQFVTSVSSGLFIRSAWLVPDNMQETLLKIADAPWLLRVDILLAGHQGNETLL